MMSEGSITRRDFMMASSAAAMTATAGKSFGASIQASKSWTIACRDAHLSVTKAPDVWAAMKQIGATGVEVAVSEDMQCSYLYHAQKKYAIDSADSIAALKDDLQKSGFQITSFLMANRFDERPEFELEWCSKVAAAAKALNVHAIRIDVVPRKLAGQREEFVRFAIDTGKKLVDIVKDVDVSFGIENHGNTTNDPEFLKALFGGVKSKKLGLTLDTGNFYWYGHPLSKLYEIYETFAPYACHTHCKSIAYPDEQKNSQRQMGWEYGKYNCPIDRGDIDFAKVVDILKKSGYQGDLCIENESLGKFPEAERGDVLRKEVEYLRRLI
ncbi:MAG: sugar phosphate isomerase/epimerase [Candidatus Omnitrophica bacterium]|nr:sugar phosphate isomerase/epimerase [Candidatus Omnitrophota bacterium]